MDKLNDWKGIKRELIPWFPVVDTDKCTGCKECFNFCSHEVYVWDNENDKSIVANPYNCVAGCSTCAGLCANNAITFPPLSILKNIKK